MAIPVVQKVSPVAMAAPIKVVFAWRADAVAQVAERSLTPPEDVMAAEVRRVQEAHREREAQRIAAQPPAPAPAPAPTPAPAAQEKEAPSFRDFKKMKPRAQQKVLKEMGYQAPSKGNGSSHKQLCNGAGKRVTYAAHGNSQLKPKTAQSILDRAKSKK